MKKLLIAILILAMMPVIALAEDPDPIVGGYYLYFNADETPELAAFYSDNSLIVGVYLFQSDGVIMLSGTEVRKTGENESNYSFAGNWSKTDDQYSYSIIGIGEGNCYIENGDLYIFLESGMNGMKLHKLIPFNPYKDYIFK